MNTSLPPALAPYIQQCLEHQSLTLVTSVLDTPANWLLARFLTTALLNGPSAESRTGSKVIFASLWRPLETWSELTRKIGLNFQHAITSSKLCYIDGVCTPFHDPQTSNNAGMIQLQRLTIKDLEAAVSSALQRLAGHNSTTQATIILDGLDFILAVEPHTTADDLQRLVLELQSKAHSVVLTCAADSALLHNADTSATPLELGHATLVRSLAHQAGWVFQLRPLETGQSREVSGSIRVSLGASNAEVEVKGNLDEGEWLFHHTNAGDVKVWGRGET